MTTWDAILAAVQTALGAGGAEARVALMDCWASTGDDDAAQRCVLAHYLADMQTGLDDEITWDERALDAWYRVADADLAPVGVPSAAGFGPSLHLNLGDGYRRAGRTDEARAQMEAGLALVSSLGDDGYGAAVRNGLIRLRDRLDAEHG